MTIQLNDVSQTFASGLTVLSGINTSLNYNDFTAIIGPTGCGKSTLLKIVAGLISPTEGEVVNDIENTENNIGFVFQDPTLMPWANVYDNVFLPSRLRNSNETGVSKRISEVINWVGLKDFTSSYPRELSGGMKMRVSIARALSIDPKLILFDEPFAALDEFTRFKLNSDLSRLWQEHEWTSLFVTHNIREAAYLANRIIVLSARPGKIIADLEVPFPFPRENTLFNSHEFTDYCADVSGYLENSLN